MAIIDQLAPGLIFTAMLPLKRVTVKKHGNAMIEWEDACDRTPRGDTTRIRLKGTKSRLTHHDRSRIRCAADKSRAQAVRFFYAPRYL